MSPSRVKTLKIDDRECGAHEEQTILEVARENGISIPTLCYVQGLSTLGACRMCLVEIEGSNRLVPACATFVDEGMVVHTDTERLRKYRRMILELLFSERNHVCAVCVSNGFCELQDMARRLGMDSVRFPYRFPKQSVDASHKQYALDHNRCILCGRCVRICDEIEGAHTWDVTGRGVECRIVSDLNQPWGESPTCTACGKCVQICPTGSLFEKGKAVAEMEKAPRFLPYLTLMRKRER